MKKTLLITMLALLGMSQMVAQEYEYVPFVREGVKWVYFYINEEAAWHPADPELAYGKNYLTLEIKGDTVINGKYYKAMHKYSGNSINYENDTIPVYLREEDQIVYGIVPEGKTYRDCFIGYGENDDVDHSIYIKVQTGQEFVLYDFKDTNGFFENDHIFSQNVDDYYYSFIRCDTITTGCNLVKCNVIKRFHQENYIIESIGFDGYGSGYTLAYFYFELQGDPPFHLSHVIENGEIIYKGVHYSPDALDAIEEVVADQSRRVADGNYYDLMGRAVGKEVPTVPGIYIHQGIKICVGRMP